jgi:hypothetical protein
VKATAAVACFVIILSSEQSPAASHDSELLAQLDHAEALWNSAGLTDYGYSLTQGGVFGYTQYKVRIRKGRCSASSHPMPDTSKGAWQRTGCEGLTIPELFQDIRRELMRGTVRARAEFDKTFGYVMNFSADPDTRIPDQGWYLKVTEFKFSHGT